MNFELSEDQRLLRDSVRDFLAAELPLEASRRIMEHEPRGFDVPPVTKGQVSPVEEEEHRHP